MILDDIAFIIFIVCIIVSIIFMYISLNRPRTRKGLRRQILSQWVERNLAEPSANAIQAIRNQILVNSAFISALLISLGLIIGLANQIFLSNEKFLFGYLGNITIGILQQISLLGCQVISLISFINSNRMASNLSYLLTSDAKDVEVEQTPGTILVQDAFRITQRSWMIGIRGIFYTIVSLTWIINSILFIISSILMTIYLILMHDYSIFSKKV